jgi:hypothetical protein
MLIVWVYGYVYDACRWIVIGMKLSRYLSLFKVVDHQYLKQVKYIFLPKLFTSVFWGCPHPFR